MSDTPERRKEVIDFIHKMLQGPWEKRSRVTETLQPIVNDYGLLRATFAWSLTGNSYDCVKFSGDVHISDIADGKHGGIVRDLLQNYKAIVSLAGAVYHNDLNLGYVRLEPSFAGTAHLVEWKWSKNLLAGTEEKCAAVASTVQTEIERHVNNAARVVMAEGYKAVTHFKSREFATELYLMDPARYSYCYDSHGRQGKIKM